MMSSVQNVEDSLRLKEQLAGFFVTQARTGTEMKSNDDLNGVKSVRPNFTVGNYSRFKKINKDEKPNVTSQVILNKYRLMKNQMMNRQKKRQKINPSESIERQKDIESAFEVLV
jgi:DNA modification methylase